MNILRLFFAFMSLFPSFLFAQRVEIEGRYMHDTFRAIPFGEKGVLLFYENKNNKKEWIFTHYNANLEKNWTSPATINHKLYYAGYDTDGKFLYVLFMKQARDQYQIVQVDTENGAVKIHDFFAIKNLEIGNFLVLNGYAFIEGVVKKMPLVLHYDLAKQQNRVLSASLQRKLEIESIEKDTAHDLVHLAVRSQQVSTKELFMKSFKPNGDLAFETILSNKDFKLTSGKMNIINAQERIITGAYAVRDIEIAEGIYIARILNNKTESLRFYNFADFKHFFDFLPKRQQENMEKRAQRRQSQGKNLSLNYRLLMHNLVVEDDKLLIVAENYYPVYRYVSNSRMGIGFGGMSMYSSQRVFDGYQYTHAIVATFDTDGKLLWDECFKLDERYMKLKKLVRTQAINQQLNVFYSADGFIRSKTYSQTGETIQKNENRIETGHLSDKIVDSAVNELSYWYDNYYLAWGYQRIRNREEKESRNVFYMNKIAGEK